MKQRGGEIVGSEGYLADEKDFRSAIVRLRGANPDSIALISYYPDGAQLTRQIRQAGITQPIVAGGSIYSPKFLELGGERSTACSPRCRSSPTIRARWCRNS